MPRAIQIQEQLTNKVMDIYRSGNDYKAIPKASGLQRTLVSAIIQRWNGGKPSQEWLADRSDPKNTATTHPGSHKETQDNV